MLAVLAVLAGGAAAHGVRLSWPAASPAVRAPVPRVVPTPVAVAALHAFERQPAVSLDVSRNVFEFGGSSPAARGMLQSMASRSPETARSTADALPVLQLIGVEQDDDTGGSASTAIISGAGQLFFVRKGENVTARYRVSTISDTVAELVDTVDGTRRDLGF